ATDFALTRYAPAPTAAEEGPEEAGVSVSPNPFSERVTVTLPAPEGVRVALYDLLGREVAVLHDGVLPAGVHRFDVGALPSGVYVLRVGGGAVVVTRR